MAAVRRHSGKLACGAIALMTGLFVACSGFDGNVNAPQGNAIGKDRLADFMRVVAHARALPAGKHSAHTLPQALQLKNLEAVHVLPGKAYALQFPSVPIDSDPIYVYVEDGVRDPEGVVRAFVADHSSWRFGRGLDDPGWYYVHGP